MVMGEKDTGEMESDVWDGGGDEVVGEFVCGVVGEVVGEVVGDSHDIIDGVGIGAGAAHWV